MSRPAQFPLSWKDAAMPDDTVTFSTAFAYKFPQLAANAVVQASWESGSHRSPDLARHLWQVLVDAYDVTTATQYVTTAPLPVSYTDPEDSEESRQSIVSTTLWRVGAPPTWVTVYSLDQGFGGPEEGGWWYSIKVPVISRELAAGENTVELVAALEAEYPRTGRQYSVNGGGDFSVELDWFEGESSPKFRPHYE